MTMSFGISLKKEAMFPGNIGHDLPDCKASSQKTVIFVITAMGTPDFKQTNPSAACLTTLSVTHYRRIFLEGLRKTRNLSVRITGLHDEILTLDQYRKSGVYPRYSVSVLTSADFPDQVRDTAIYS
jgi:hypothetical protein